MPELPEVETTKTSLLPLLEQKVINVEVRQASLRWPIPDDLLKLKGQKLLQLTRRSKYILAQFEQDSMLWHLGMSGSFRICDAQDELRKHDHFILDFGEQQLRYHDPRRFGCILWLNEESQHKLLDPLGPEFAPQRVDINLDGITLDLFIPPIDAVFELGARERHARLFDQRVQQGEFSPRETHRQARQRHFVRRRIER